MVYVYDGRCGAKCLLVSFLMINIKFFNTYTMHASSPEQYYDIVLILDNISTIYCYNILYCVLCFSILQY